MFLNRMSIPISRIMHRQPIAFVLPSLRRHSSTEKKDIFNDFDDFDDVLEILGNHRSSSEHTNTGTDGQTKTPPLSLSGDTRHPLNRIADIMEKTLHDQRHAMHLDDLVKTEQAKTSRATMEELRAHRDDMLKALQAAVSENKKQTMVMDQIVSSINHFKTMISFHLCCHMISLYFAIHSLTYK